MQLSLHQSGALHSRPHGQRSRRPVPCASKAPDHCLEHGLDLGPLGKALTAAAAVVVLTGGVGAARADDSAWKPRRHHRHIGERFTDTWADAIAEVRCRTGLHTCCWSLHANNLHFHA